MGLRAAPTSDREAARSALNLQRAIPAPARRSAADSVGPVPEPYVRAAERDLAPWLMLAALLLALADLVIALALRGLLPARLLAGRQPAAALLFAAGRPAPWRRTAGTDDARIIELTRETRLAYVVTGDADVDGKPGRPRRA